MKDKCLVCGKEAIIKNSGPCIALGPKDSMQRELLKKFKEDYWSSKTNEDSGEVCTICSKEYWKSLEKFCDEHGIKYLIVN